ncbi:VOC family protein [Chishuiella changwenlii]|uniref:VOC family protein n=1 Tax=Chishuiella changwenlii TaxID=1434701 RepID=UPI002FD8E9DA
MKINHIKIETPNLEDTIAFYKEKLDLEVIEVTNETATIQVGESLLTFIQNKNNQPVYHLAFNIPANQLKEAINWSKNRLDLIHKENDLVVSNFETWKANSVYFFDNNGNLLEFITRKDLKNETEKPFNSQQILNISEIGIVTEKPDELGKALIEKYQLELFDKNDNSKVFTAIGDDEGLLIIVKENRNWFPTEIPAQAFTTEIKVIDKNNIHTINLN